jgi:adenine phosphoribosyltransferase
VRCHGNGEARGAPDRPSSKTISTESEKIMSEKINLKDYIRSQHDFPKPGIVFRDITPLLASAVAFRETIQRMADHFRGRPIDVVAAAEARGFIFAAPLAIELGVGFMPVRKPTKVPFSTHAFDYTLDEYHTDVLEAYKATIDRAQRILFVDDLLATGSSIETCCRLIEQAGGHIAGCAFLIELTSLAGRARIASYDTFSLLAYT